MTHRYSFRIALLIVSLIVTAGASAQQDTTARNIAVGAETSNARSAPAAAAGSAALDLARAAVAAQGGDHFRNRQSVVLSGVVDFYVPNAMTAVSGQFVIATQGNCLYRELRVPNFTIKEIFDGQRGYVSMRGIHFPPPDKFGMDVLAKFDQPGYTVTTLPDKKKMHAFRISDVDGHATDFFIDSETSRILRYEFKYEGLNTSMEFEPKSQKQVDGLLVSHSFSERLDTEQGTFFLKNTVKDVRINQLLNEGSFAIPGR